MVYRTPEFDSYAIRCLAVAASCDPRSVVRVLNGDRVRGPADTRIRAVLRERGHAVPVPAAHPESVP